MWRIVAVSIGGAVTIASRFVTCESVSVVTRIASSSSRRTSDSASGGGSILGGQQPVDEVAVPGLGRHAAGRGVRVLQQPQLLEAGELVPDRRRPPVEAGGERLGAHGRAAGEVLLDDALQNQFLALAQHPEDSRSGRGVAHSAGRAAQSADARCGILDQLASPCTASSFTVASPVGDRLRPCR